MSADYSAELSAIVEAIATGELSVSYEGRTVQYQNAADLEARYNFLKRLQSSSATPRPRSSTLTGFRRGY
jgi:hypothetical protein